MLSLLDPTRLKRVLCVGAHSDDVEIGCGATIVRLLRDVPNLKVVWCVLCAGGTRGDEARASAAQLGVEIVCHAFRDAHLPASWAEVKQAVADLRQHKPDAVFAHRGGDAHQDHRLVAELVDQTFRNHVVLGYEIPKYDGDLSSQGQPNVFAPATDTDLDAKLRLLDCFHSQRDKHWFDDATFRGLARLRGLECASPTGHAEAFYCRKLTF